MMTKQLAWLKQIDSIMQGEQPVCPSCHGNNTECRFYVFPEGVGFGDIKCKDCGEWMHISRMGFPEDTKIEITKLEE